MEARMIWDRQNRRLFLIIVILSRLASVCVELVECGAIFTADRWWIWVWVVLIDISRSFFTIVARQTPSLHAEALLMWTDRTRCVRVKIRGALVDAQVLTGWDLRMGSARRRYYSLDMSSALLLRLSVSFRLVGSEETRTLHLESFILALLLKPSEVLCNCICCFHITIILTCTFTTANLVWITR